jgi:magnesium-transporting ATPase (P-type)
LFNDKKIGLTTKEAEMSKPNKEKKKSDGSYLRILFKNLCTPFNLVLVAIALTYFILGFIFQSTELHSFSNYTFLVIAFLNSAISIVSEFYSKHILNKMNIVDVAEYETFRDNELVKLSSDKLV